MAEHDLSLKARYQKLATQRLPYEERARECAKLTIPTLYPDQGANSATTFTTPYQSVGARGLNNLASKLLLTIMPPQATTNFFRLTVDEQMLEKLTGQEGLTAEIDKTLAKFERAVQLDLEASGDRAVVFEALKLILATGQVVVKDTATGLKMFRLNSFVCKRSPTGKPLCAIIHEKVAVAELPDYAKPFAKKAGDIGTANEYDDTVDVYTEVKFMADKVVTSQEIDGKILPEATVIEPADKHSWMVIAPLLVNGEDYARSFVEEYLGDLYSLEGLSAALLKAAAAVSKVVYLVRPNSMTDVEELNAAESGDYVTGAKDDIATIQLEKYPDLKFVADQIVALEKRLSYAFLLNTAIQRNGERVTAEEIRYMATELEGSLGGIYVSLSNTFQKPLVQKRIHKLTKQGRLPPLPEGVVKVTIITGVEAIGRTTDLQKLDQLVKDIQNLGPQALAYLNMGEWLSRRCTNLGISSEGLVLTEDEFKEQQAQAMQAQMAQEVAPNVVDAAAAQAAPAV